MKRKHLYYSLAVCVVACFVAAFSIFGSSPAGNVTSNKETTNLQKEKEAAVPVTDVRDTRDDEVEDVEVTTQTPDPLAHLAENVPYKSEYVLPVSTKISRDYSDGELVYSEIHQDYRAHNGVDFSSDKDTPVKSIISGVVLSVSKEPVFGNVIEIDHGNGLIGRYCGLEKIEKAAGDLVEKGEAIGTVGVIPTEGENYHLHFETLIDGKYVDPLAVMGKG